MNNNSRNEFFKAAGFIMLLVLNFLPVMVQVFAIFVALIYIIFDVIRLKKREHQKYDIVFDVLLALAAILIIFYLLIKTKFTALSIYQNYILVIAMIFTIVITILLPLVIRYKQGGWKNIKSGIWMSVGWTIIFISALYKLFNS